MGDAADHGIGPEHSLQHIWRLKWSMGGRFVEVTWPVPTPGPGVPTAPTGLTATPNTDGGIHLAWQGTASGYVVYMRDITAGWTNFVRMSLPSSQTFADPLPAVALSPVGGSGFGGRGRVDATLDGLLLTRSDSFAGAQAPELSRGHERRPIHHSIG